MKEGWGGEVGNEGVDEIVIEVGTSRDERGLRRMK